MRGGRIAFAAAAGAVLLLYIVGVALAYYARISICWYPPHIVSDEERIANVLGYLEENARHHPGLRNVDPTTCCSIERDRNSGEYGVTLGSVAKLKWVELVRIRYGENAEKTSYMPTTQCGLVANQEY